jgi:acetyl esterase/lipase
LDIDKGRPALPVSGKARPPRVARMGAFHIAALCAAFTAQSHSCRAQEAVDLSGAVSDATGKPIAGAIVRLTGRNLADTTDAAGKYKIGATGTALRGIPEVGTARSPGGAPGTGIAPVWMDGELRFLVADAPQKISITLHSPSGRRLGAAAVAALEPGRYRFNPASASAATGARFARIRIGDVTLAVETPWFRPSGGGNGFARIGEAEAPGTTGKIAAAPAGGDSLDVLAIGYERGARAVASLSGTQDFKLAALKYTDVPYKSGNLPAYEKQMTTLDVHVPTGPMRKWPVIVHLHGGGLQEGDSKEGWSASDKNNAIRKIWEQGYLMVCPNYRLGIDPDLPNGGAPRGKYPDYLRDAAAAVAWAKKNAEQYGGDPDNLFVMGYSAGAWLSLMLAIDTTWYSGLGFDRKGVRGYMPLSAQTYTYGEYAIEFKISDRSISPGAALNYVRKVEAPIHLFVGSLEEAASKRVSDNQTFVQKMKAVGNDDLELSVMAGRDHEHIISSIGNATDETRDLLLAFLKKYGKK